MTDVEKGKMLAQVMGFVITRGSYNERLWIITPPPTWEFDWWTATQEDDAYRRVLHLCSNYEDYFVFKPT